MASPGKPTQRKRVKQYFSADYLKEDTLQASPELHTSQDEVLKSLFEGVLHITNKYNSSGPKQISSTAIDVKAQEEPLAADLAEKKAEETNAEYAQVDGDAEVIDKAPVPEKGLHDRKDQSHGAEEEIHEVKDQVLLDNEDPNDCLNQEGAIVGSEPEEAGPVSEPLGSATELEVPDQSGKVPDLAEGLGALALSVHDSIKEHHSEAVVAAELEGNAGTATSPAKSGILGENGLLCKRNGMKRKHSDASVYQPPHRRRIAPRSVVYKAETSDSASNNQSPQKSASQEENPVSSKASDASLNASSKEVPNVWKSAVHPWNKEKAKMRGFEIASMNEKRGPAPKRFSTPINDPALQRLINVGPRLPDLHAQLEAYLPDWLQKIPNPICKVKRQKQPENKSTEVSIKHGVKPKKTDQKAVVPVAANSGASKTPLALTIGNLNREELLALQEIGDKARAARKRGSAGSLATHHGKLLLGKPEQKVGCNDPPTRLMDLQKKSVDLLVKQFPELHHEMAVYEREDHGGAPTQISGYLTLDKENLSDFSDPPEQETVQAVHRWRWFTAMVESIASADSDEESLASLHCQLVEWDGAYEGPSVNLGDRAKFELPASRFDWFDTWMDSVARNTLKRPFQVDITKEEFTSGRGHVSGMRREYVEFPPDSLFKLKAPNFGPIDWDSFDIRSPEDPFSQAPLRRKQSAMICSLIAGKEWMNFKNAMSVRKDQAEKNAYRTARLIHDGVIAPPAYRHPNKAIMEDNPWLPSANVYIRPAQKRDMEQVFVIYNRYILEGVQALEHRILGEGDWVNIFENTETEKFPFLVAVQKTRKGKGLGDPDPWGQKIQRGRGRKAPHALPRQEKILGFVYGECFGFTGSSLEDTIEVQLWVDHEHKRQGIGKNLLDRFIPCVDLLYQSHRGTDFMPPPGDEGYYSGGGRRAARKLVINLFYEESHPEEFKWKKQHLESEWAFRQTGFYRDLAEKFDRPVNMASFMRDCPHTGAKIAADYLECPTCFRPPLE